MISPAGMQKRLTLFEAVTITTKLCAIVPQQVILSLSLYKRYYFELIRSVI
jgi:hypothetical protein